MSTTTVYGGQESLRFFRVKSDHTQLLKPKPDATGTAPTKTEFELVLQLVGSAQLDFQDDGTAEIAFTIGEHHEDLTDFFNNYRPAGSSSSRGPFKTDKGAEYGGSAGGNADPLLAVYSGGKNAETEKVHTLVSICELRAASGSMQTDPENPTQRTLTVKTLTPKADLVFHDNDAASTGFSVYDANIVDFSTETSDIQLSEGDLNIEFWVAAGSGAAA